METFSPAKQQSSTSLTGQEIISIVRLVFSVVAAGVWNEVIPALGLFTNSNDLGWTKDTVNNIVQGGLRLTGNFFDPGE